MRLPGHHARGRSIIGLPMAEGDAIKTKWERARMDLKELLGEELYHRVAVKLGDRRRIALVSDGSWIPKDKFNEVRAAKKRLEASLRERDAQLAGLKQAVGEYEALKQAVERLRTECQAQAESYEARLAELTLTSAVKLAIAGRVHDPELVLGLLDKSKFKLHRGTVEGLDEQIEALRERKAFLFADKPGPVGPNWRTEGGFMMTIIMVELAKEMLRQMTNGRPGKKGDGGG